MITLLWLIILLAITIALIFQQASLFVSSITLGVALLLCTFFHGMPSILLLIFWVIWILLALLNVASLRLRVTARILSFYCRVMPKMSKTEQEALNAGSVCWDGELFSGKPDWSKLLTIPKPVLTKEEQAFIDGPAAELCRMVDDWRITQIDRALPKDVWAFIREHEFFGLMIPKEYGGKGFSAQAHAAILIKVYSCGVTVGTTVAVPNSLGPAELILHYGTKQQKDYYLPRLAKGEEVPCFALTGPDAGSDATAMPDYGVVCHGEHEGKKVLGIKMNWNKRYITLCPVATVLGLAFKLYDPDHLIGKKEDIGITCALIPTNHKGVVIGRRHYPASAVFQNGPTQGKDVFIPIDWVIGGQKMVGTGWKMLVECLSVGRSVSLPATGVTSAKIAALSSGAYARIRRQFNLPIGKFEGIEEVLAKIAGLAYQTDAAQQLTLTVIDGGEIPAVPSAILKYHLTEMGRAAIEGAMDIHGGKAVCMGPKNPLALGFQSSPIAITVEGANILTRNMIIFGQGSIRCHPFVLKELTAAQLDDKAQALKEFDQALWGHIGFALGNVARSFVHGITGAYFAKTPNGKAKRFYQQFSRFSSAFALMTDAAMAIYGGELKRRERVSARLGDILSYLYIGSAVLKRFRDHGEPKEEWALVKWCCLDMLYKIQATLNELLLNLPDKVAASVLRFIIMPLGKRVKCPSDKLGHELAQLLMNPSETRSMLCHGICIDEKAGNTLGLLEKTLLAAIEIEPIEKRIRLAKREGKITGRNFTETVKDALKNGVINKQEFNVWQKADILRHEVLAVDDFDSNLK